MAADPQHIVDKIRAFVAAADQTLTPDLKDLAVDYATHCNDANARLRRCVDHLRRGLRAEAIHLAEEPPPLLELVSALDFPEIPQWANVCAMYELQRPPPLLIELAQELNEAYAAAEPTKPWLDLHRRLALEHAPLAERIAVMRELAKLDTASSFWDDDLRLFESTRLKQLRNELPIAGKSRDRKMLDALQAEITAEGWRVEVPADLKAAVVRAHAALRQDQAVTQINEWLPQLDSAYGAMDLPAVSGLVDKIRRLATDTKLTLPADLLEKIDPPEQWVRRERAKAARKAEIEDAVTQLSHAVAGDHPLEALHGLAADVVQAGGVVPDDLADRIQEVEVRDAAKKTRARRQWIGIAVGLAAAIAVGVGLAARTMIHDSVGRRAYDTLFQHHSQHNLAAAEADLKRFDNESPYVLKRSDIAELATRVKADREAEKTRLQDLTTELKSTDEAIKTAAAKGDFTDAAWSPAESHLKKLNQLARSSSERADADERRSRIVKIRDETRGDKDGQFRRRIEQLETRRDGSRSSLDADTLTATDIDDAIKQATTLVADISDERLSETRRRAERVHGELVEIKTRRDLRLREHDALVRVKTNCASASRLKTALEQYTSDCSGTDRATVFEKAIEKADTWAAVEKVSRQIDKWTNVLSPGSVETMSNAVADALAAGETPWSDTLTDYQKYIAVLKTAQSTSGPWKGAFANELDDKIYKDIRYIRGKVSGKRYYVLEKTQEPRGGINSQKSDRFPIKYIKTYAALGGAKTPQDIVATTLPPEDYDGQLRNTPQFDLKKALGLPVLNPADDGGKVGFDIVDKIIKAKEVDPIVRVQLLQVAVGALNETTIGTDALAEYADKIKRFDTHDISWIDPEDAKANSEREDAEKILSEKMDILKRARDEVMAECRTMRAALGRCVVGRGVLLKDGPRWTVFPADPVGAAVEVVTPAGKSWDSVGHFRDGKFDPAANIDDAMDGSMVFFLPPATGGNAARAAK